MTHLKARAPSQPSFRRTPRPLRAAPHKDATVAAAGRVGSWNQPLSYCATTSSAANMTSGSGATDSLRGARLACSPIIEGMK